MANLTINTTQHIQIEFKSASSGSRIGAFLLDSILKLGYILVVSKMIDSSRFVQNFEDSWSRAAVFILIFSPVIFYSVCCEIMLQGYTVGKKILKIRVIKIDGYQATMIDYVIRWIMNIVDIYLIWGLIGLVSMSVSKKQQRLGDMLAGTAVISMKERINLSATIFQEVEDTYTPIFNQVLSLSDNDMRIIKEAYITCKKNRDVKLLQKLVDKVTSVIGVEPGQYSNAQFIEVVLKDYNYLTSRI